MAVHGVEQRSLALIVREFFFSDKGGNKMGNYAVQTQSRRGQVLKFSL